MRSQIQCALDRYEEMGVCVNYLPGFIHEKVAVIDRQILWEGSLNILSQKASREMMRRTVGENPAMQMITYLNLGKKLEEGYRHRYEKLCHNLVDKRKQNKRAKVAMFFLGLLIPLILWLGFICFKTVTLPRNVELVTTILKSLAEKYGDQTVNIK